MTRFKNPSILGANSVGRSSRICVSVWMRTTNPGELSAMERERSVSMMRETSCCINAAACWKEKARMRREGSWWTRLCPRRSEESASTTRKWSREWKGGNGFVERRVKRRESGNRMERSNGRTKFRNKIHDDSYGKWGNGETTWMR